MTHSSLKPMMYSGTHTAAGELAQIQEGVRPKRLGLAISAGGAKGLAHVGVIQVLEENNIPIAAVSGVSMGAYVGALWCAGYTGPQLVALAEEIQTPKTMRKLSDPAFPPTRGLFYGRKAKAHLYRSIGDITFDRLMRPLYIIATDIDTYERLVCHEGKVVDAVHASCALPGVIVPVHHQGHRCVDGGVVDPVPVSILHQFAEVDAVIAISTIPSIDEIDHCASKVATGPERKLLKRLYKTALRPINLLAKGNIIDTFVASLKASQIRMAHDSCKHADIVIKPISCIGRWYDYHQYDHFIGIGREAAQAALPAIRKLLNPVQNNASPRTDMVGESLN
ncbi:patatin-like phospholipase family protein [Coraliomargarita parva]|uniref:patatin-like phospholipase family protein n=1 Tax=Coraliomargarita parva TaxID=3014050 RepID=UPI0022B2D290|nr:patatin-like phospholipase family protein [Coraliomargarita parva]